jgi:hypothetical protein
VPLFQPIAIDEILQGIGNRELSEQRKYDALNTNNFLKSQMDKDIIRKAYEISVQGKISEKK